LIRYRVCFVYATLTKRGAFHSFEFRVSGLGLVIQFKTRN
jgi:hypothetical protein